jgi:hypothetical protein
LPRADVLRQLVNLQGDWRQASNARERATRIATAITRTGIHPDRKVA